MKNVLLVTNAGNKSGEAFGTGTIYLEGGAGIVGWSSYSTASTHNENRGDAYVYNNIDVTGVNYFRSDGDVLDGTTNPNFQITVLGNITGNEDAVLVRQGGGYKFSPRGDNSGYAGDWIIRSDYVDSDNTNTKSSKNDATTHTDYRFGSGTIYITDGAGIQGGNGTAIYSDVTVNNGQTGNFRNGNPSFYGTLTADGTFASSNTLNIYGELQGRGTVNAAVVMQNDSKLNPGVVGVSQYDLTSYEKSAVADQPVGTLTITGPLTMQDGSILNLDFASTTNYDKIQATGNLSLDGVQVNIDFLDGFNASDIKVGDTFEFISTTGTDTSVDIQDILAPTYDSAVIADMYYGAQFDLVSTATGLALRATVDGNMVPEPATWALLVFGFGAGVVVFRKKRI